MQANKSVRRLVGLMLFIGVATLPACVQPRVAELSKQLEDTARYAARMEEIYASQEAEILSLRKELASRGNPSEGE